MDTGIMKSVVPIIAHSLYNARRRSGFFSHKGPMPCYNKNVARQYRWERIKMDGLQVHEIRKVYGSTAVVDNVSFQAPQGRILGVLGPNGAGKTTIIRMIMGITAPDQGEVLFTNQGR